MPIASRTFGELSEQKLQQLTKYNKSRLCLFALLKPKRLNICISKKMR